MIASVLVANRGEIARRIFRTARSMGLRCVAVYVDADAEAPFVEDADVAVRLSTGYLDGAAIVAAAKEVGADAVHPGYGFLSENAEFARAVDRAGLTWIGPAPEVIESMGDKIAAKGIAIGAGVPTLPSTEDRNAAHDIGYPLLVKASAGGGGKGMRAVAGPDDLAEAVAAAQREALSSFGDERVFLEKYLPRARHVEIQILGDAHGNLVHLGERECSIQRRHQKVIEETPSPIVDLQMRTKMGESALSLGRAMGYQSTGTVEFLVDDESRQFYFLEVNTRLQVEHPVTEEVTGIDLVREQIRVAAGEVLGFGQSDIGWNGHAIEARLYAEDPDNGFLPVTGTLSAFVEPTDPAVRWDSGVQQGSVIGPDFDPMIAKVVAHAPTRSEAAGRLARALERLHIGGVTTNRDFLAATLRSAEYLKGDTTTDFIERVDLVRTSGPGEEFTAAVAAAMWLQEANRSEDHVWGFAPSNWRNGGLPSERVVLAMAGADDSLTIAYQARRDGSFSLDSSESVTVHRWSQASIDVEVDGVRRAVDITREGTVIHVQTEISTLTFHIVPRFVVPGREIPAGGLTAPMPGVVLDVRGAIGDVVEAGQVLVVLEAMKMEHHIAAPTSGTITQVAISAGQQLDNGALLMTIDDGHGDQGDVE